MYTRLNCRSSVVRVLGAFLTDRVPLTTARVRQRIQAGAPIYGTSPERPMGAQRRVPFQPALTPQIRARLSPEAYGALFSMVPAAKTIPAGRLGAAMMQSGAADTRYQQDTGAVYTQAQILLAAWGKAGGPIQPPDFGRDDDFTGKDSPRTVDAIVSFQRWANSQGANIRDDGVLDDLTLGQMVITTAEAIEAQRQKPKSMLPLWLVVGGLVVAVAYSEYGGGRSK